MDSLSKKYYKIREVAEILGLPASTLRFWEKEFTIIKPRRNEHGTRFYTPADIDRIAMIHYLVHEKGLRLDAAQEEIRRNPEGLDRRWRAVARLKQIRSQLTSMIEALDSLRR